MPWYEVARQVEEEGKSWKWMANGDWVKATESDDMIGHLCIGHQIAIDDV